MSIYEIQVLLSVGSIALGYLSVFILYEWFFLHKK